MAERVVKVRLSAQIAEYQRGMAEAARSTRDVGTEAEKLAQKREAFQGLGRMAVVMGTAMAALGYAVAKTGIEYNTLQQKSRAALTTLLGGAEAANAQMDKLDAFARTSPFAKQVFITAQQQMLAFGISAQKVVPYLDAIQDAVAAAGGSSQRLAEVAFVMSQVSAAGKITGQDLIQFGQRGINAAELIGLAMGKTGAQIREEITAGTLGADEALDALAEGMKTRFDGAAANVKQTFEGAMDRVSAAWRDLSADLMKPLVDPNGGGALVDFLNWTADVLRAFQALPDPIKQTMGLTYGLITATLLLGGAYVALQPRIAAFKANLATLGWSMKSLSLAGGAVTLALTALTAIVLAVGNAQAAARQKAEAYTDALREGADAVRDLAVKNLQAEDSFLWMSRGSAFDAAERLGVSLETLTDAATGNADALDELSVYLKAADGDMDALRQITDATGLSNIEAASVLDVMVTTLREQIDAQGEANRLMGQAEGATEGAADETANLEQAARDAVEALDLMSEALDAVGGEAMTASEAVDKAQSAVNRLKEAAEAEGVALDGTNDASIKFRDAIRDVETSHRDAAEAILENGGTLEEARAEYGKGREAIIKMLEAKGLDRAEAERWADTNLGSASEVEGALKGVKDAVDDIPEKKAIQLTANTSDARARVREFIREYDGKVVNMTLRATQVVVQGRVYGGLRDGSYMGNMYEHGQKVQGFYQGGFPSGVYAGVQGGIHKFAESEMGVPWETYISGRAADRERNVGIWMETGKRLGALGAGGGPVEVELGPASRRALTREVVNLVRIDQESIGQAANSANASHAFRGGGGLG